MNGPMHVDNARLGLPDRSIWLEMPHGGQTAWVLTTRVETPHGLLTHAERMALSKFGKPNNGSLAVGPMEEAAGTKLNRAKRMAGGYQTLGMRI